MQPQMTNMMDTLTKIAINKYKKSPDHCPYCGEDNITAGHFEPEANYIPVRCHNCDKKWNELYELITIEKVEI